MVQNMATEPHGLGSSQSNPLWSKVLKKLRRNIKVTYDKPIAIIAVLKEKFKASTKIRRKSKVSVYFFYSEPVSAVLARE